MSRANINEDVVYTLIGMSDNQAKERKTNQISAFVQL